MKHTKRSAMTLLLAAALLLSGCAKREAPLNTDTNPNLSSSESESNFSDNTNSDNSLNNDSDNLIDPIGTSEDPSDTSKALTPLSFTEDDMKLQEILTNLIDNGGAEVYGWFYSLDLSNYGLASKFRFLNSQSPEAECSFFPVPENYRDGRLSIPTTYDEMEKTVGEFFTKRAAARFMNLVCKGTVSEDSNGVSDILIDDINAVGIPPLFLEINGQLYRRDAVGTSILNVDCETAKVTNHDDGIIEFTYLKKYYDYEENTKYKNEESYPDHALVGYIELEDGKWKLPYWEHAGFEQRQ